MMKASPKTTHFRHWLEGDLLMLAKLSVWAEILTALARRSTRGHRGSRYPNVVLPVAVLSGAIALWCWNASLLLALAAGGGSSILVYRMAQRQFLTRQLEQWLRSPNAPIVLSIGGGIGMLALSYGALAVWQDLDSPWLAMMLLTQEMGFLGVLGLAVWLMSARQNKPPHSFDRCVAGLLHRDELRRLMAVRQLAALTARGQISALERSHALDYLHLLACRETSPLVGKAIQESLALLAPPSRQQSSERATMSARRIKPSLAVTVRQEAMADAG
ncbi:hypothetical protein [Altericista sp. CCNU0014]|uniref:hypothetical protein n=1 Tax=Altericista sp. CCNU0014 TaxID=3082949 RepID=UPI00384A861F